MQRLTFLCSRAGEGQEEKAKEDRVPETFQHQSCYSNQLLTTSEDFFSYSFQLTKTVILSFIYEIYFLFYVTKTARF